MNFCKRSKIYLHVPAITFRLGERGECFFIALNRLKFQEVELGVFFQRSCIVVEYFLVLYIRFFSYVPCIIRKYSALVSNLIGRMHFLVVKSFSASFNQNSLVSKCSYLILKSIDLVTFHYIPSAVNYLLFTRERGYVPIVEKFK